MCVHARAQHGSVCLQDEGVKDIRNVGKTREDFGRMVLRFPESGQAVEEEVEIVCFWLVGSDQNSHQ